MKVPEPRQLSSGNWFIYLRLGGEGIPVTEPSRAACIRSAQLIKAEYMAGKKKPAGRGAERTVGELIDGYITRYEPVLSPATVRGYQTIRDNRFPGVMDRRPAEVRDWQKAVNEELRHVGAKTVKNAWFLVSAALRDAKEPVPDVKLPAVAEKELGFLQPEEIPPFLEAARGDPCELEMLLELHGLRASEARQVICENQIDLRAGLIRVRGAVVRGKTGFVSKETNKSRAGMRPVQILIPRLAELAGEYAARGEPLPSHSASMTLAHVHKTAARAGVTDVDNHDLRRTLASLGYSLGISEHALADVCGWDDYETMHRIYIKLAQRDRRGALDALKDFFAPETDEQRLASALETLEDLRKKCGDLPALQAVFSEVDKLINANRNCKPSTEKR